MRQIAELDFAHLPNADCIVVLEVDERDWQALLTKRNRNFDRSAGLAEAHKTQEYFINAAHAYARATGATLIHHKQVMSSAVASAEAIYAELLSHGVIAEPQFA